MKKSKARWYHYFVLLLFKIVVIIGLIAGAVWVSRQMGWI